MIKKQGGKKTVAKDSRVGSKHKTHRAPKTKKIKIKHKHTKSYRKRHLGLLTISIFIAYVLGIFIVIYSVSNEYSLQSAQNYINQIFGAEQNIPNEAKGSQLVMSTYGFSFNYDQDTNYATALDANSGDLYIGGELSTRRAYKNILISPNLGDSNEGSTSMSMQYIDDYDEKDSLELSVLEKSFVVEKQSNESSNLTKTSTEEVNISGSKFIRSIWERQSKSSDIGAGFVAKFSSYVGVVNGKPFVITINDGFKDEGSQISPFSGVIDSLKFGQPQQSSVLLSPEVLAKQTKSIEFINKLSFTNVVSAAISEVSASERNNAKYSPAVVKIYNLYCMDILLEGKLYLTNVCNGTAGSGFFVTKDGYIATNGHVTFANPKDIVIQDAFSQLFLGKDIYFNNLARLSGLTAAELKALPELEDRLQLAVDKFYSIDDSNFTATNNVSNLLVNLNEDQPDVKELQKLTKERKEYPEQDNIKKAKAIASDFRVVDGVTAFRASDVAIIKIAGDNYPTVKLGSIDSVTQGANLSILGFPSGAGDNGVIDDSQSKVSLTSGKVSSTKNALGSDKKLIETDTTIGHGNSGGPVLNDEGSVIGLATYTIDGSGKGDGVFNYIRDIKDLKDLASSNSVSIDGSISKTQTEWEKGLEYFYSARYSKAIKNFEDVKSLYSQHSRVDDFIATANQRISNGEEIKDFPVVIVAVVAGVILLGISGSVFMIIRHKKAHNVYKAHVATGAMQPIAPGAPTQQVAYNPANVAATNAIGTVVPQQNNTNIAQPGVSAINPQQQQTAMPSTPVAQQPIVVTAPKPEVTVDAGATFTRPQQPGPASTDNIVQPQQQPPVQVITPQPSSNPYQDIRK